MDDSSVVSLPGNCRLVPFDIKGDDRGSLVAIESCRHVPFEIQRVYYLFGTKAGVVRGLHAHRRLQQMVIAVRGSCIMLLDDGSSQSSITLDDPTVGLTLPPMVWHEMSEFSPDCVLLVLADAPYDEGDYIRDRDEFRQRLGEVEA